MLPRKKEAGEPYEEMERPELEKGDIPAMIIAAFITFIPVAILVLGMILVAGYFLLHCPAGDHRRRQRLLC